MKRKVALVSACTAAVGLAAGCGGGDHNNSPPGSGSPPPTSANQALDTAQVLALAQHSTDTGEPLAVNGGALTLTDTSETTQPVDLNGM